MSLPAKHLTRHIPPHQAKSGTFFSRLQTVELLPLPC